MKNTKLYWSDRTRITRFRSSTRTLERRLFIPRVPRVSPEVSTSAIASWSCTPWLYVRPSPEPVTAASTRATSYADLPDVPCPRLGPALCRDDAGGEVGLSGTLPSRCAGGTHFIARRSASRIAFRRSCKWCWRAPRPKGSISPAERWSSAAPLCRKRSLGRHWSRVWTCSPATACRRPARS